MNDHKLGDELERWRAKFIPDPIWLALGAASGFGAGRVIGRDIFGISGFQHNVGAGLLTVCLVAAFPGGREKFPVVSGVCLWLGAFSTGLLSLR